MQPKLFSLAGTQPSVESCQLYAIVDCPITPRLTAHIIKVESLFILRRLRSLKVRELWSVHKGVEFMTQTQLSRIDIIEVQGEGGVKTQVLSLVDRRVSFSAHSVNMREGGD